MRQQHVTFGNGQRIFYKLNGLTSVIPGTERRHAREAVKSETCSGCQETSNIRNTFAEDCCEVVVTLHNQHGPVRQPRCYVGLLPSKPEILIFSFIVIPSVAKEIGTEVSRMQNQICFFWKRRERPMCIREMYNFHRFTARLKRPSALSLSRKIVSTHTSKDLANCAGVSPE